MAREFDIIVFGATGFTGVRIAKYIASTVEPNTLKWALGGRSEKGLSKARKGALAGSHYFEEDIPLVIADVKDKDSLRSMCSRTKLLINAVGPYRFFGMPVVEACVGSSTDYVDVTGEPEFIERSQAGFHDQAESSQSIIVHACGFDSIPADLGLQFTASQMEYLAQAESTLRLLGSPGGHYATFESAVHGFSNVESFRRFRAEQRKKEAVVKVHNIGPKLRPKPFLFWDKDSSSYATLFPFADSAVVRNSQKQLARRYPDKVFPQYGAYISVTSNYLWLFVVLVVMIVFNVLVKVSAGRKLLLKYPKLFTAGAFSHEGPTQYQLDNTTFAMRFVGRGYSSSDKAQEGGKPDKSIVTVVSGPEPGYVATPIFVVNAALCLLEERNAMAVKGGVFTPGGVFDVKKTSIVKRLNEAGVSFSVESR